MSGGKARIIRRVIPLDLNGFPAKCHGRGEIHCETREFEVVLHTVTTELEDRKEANSRPGRHGLRHRQEIGTTRTQRK